MGPGSVLHVHTELALLHKPKFREKQGAKEQRLVEAERDHAANGQPSGVEAGCLG